MDVESQAKIMEQVFQGSAALAGLILVFLGSIYVGYDAYETQHKKIVRDKFVRRCWWTFLGFVAAIASAFFAILFSWYQNDFVFWTSLAALAGAAISLLGISVRLNLDIG